MNLKEIRAKIAALAAELRDETISAERLSAVEIELRSLKEQEQTCIEQGEKRKKLLSDVAAGAGEHISGGAEMLMPQARNNVLADTNPASAPEYRSAYLKRLQGKELSDVEQRALTSVAGSVGNAIPTETANMILTKIKQYAPLLDEITLLQVAGNVTFVMEGVTADAALHAEGATITASADTLVKVTLAGFEINKLVTISKTVATMTITAFEAWMTDMLARKAANCISGYLVTGTGSAQPQGVETAQTWGATNSVTVALAGSLTATNVRTLVGLLPGGYDAGAKFLMSKKTLFTDFMELQDNAKHDLVKEVNGVYYIYGYEVMLDERVTLHEAYLGNFKMGIAGNLAESVNITSAFDIKTNSFDYLVAAIFDSKVAIGEAFVKLVKATS